jgi:hypothetical protein
VLTEALGRPVTIADAGWLQQLWEQAAAGIGHPPVFLEREWEQVILAQGLREPDAYLSARRHGRSTPLRPEQRLPRARGPQPAWRFC